MNFQTTKKAMRIINVSKYNAHNDPLLENTKLLKTEDILKLNELKFYYKFVKRIVTKLF